VYNPLHFNHISSPSNDIGEILGTILIVLGNNRYEESLVLLKSLFESLPEKVQKNFFQWHFLQKRKIINEKLKFLAEGMLCCTRSEYLNI
jgi:hypothetical protein